jgi:glycosyltransferase involved in cell wall biosynthesis
MNTDLIYRCKENNISGYKKIIDKTYEILNKNYNLIVLTVDSQKHKDFVNKNFLNKKNFNSPEFFISPLELNKENSWDYVLPDKNNITCLTMWESTLLPRVSIKELNNNTDKVLVPSKWNKECFEQCGVKNVNLLNLFVDDNIFNYKPKTNLRKFTFFAGATLNDFSISNNRKNINLVIDCFLKVFNNINDVELIIKSTSTSNLGVPNYLSDNIRIISKNISSVDLANLYAESDVFVSSSKSEGWGFFQIESLAVGRPVITIDYGGVKEFCNKNNSFFIDYEEELASGYWAKSGGLWAKLNFDSLCEQMYFCYKNKDILRNNWLNYSKSVLPQFSLKNYEQNLLKYLWCNKYNLI